MAFPHLVHIRNDPLVDLGRKGLAVLVDLLDSKGAKYLTLVTLHCELQRMGDVRLPISEEVLGGELCNKLDMRFCLVS